MHAKFWAHSEFSLNVCCCYQLATAITEKLLCVVTAHRASSIKINKKSSSQRSRENKQAASPPYCVFLSPYAPWTSFSKKVSLMGKCSLLGAY